MVAGTARTMAVVVGATGLGAAAFLISSWLLNIPELPRALRLAAALLRPTSARRGDVGHRLIRH